MGRKARRSVAATLVVVGGVMLGGSSASLAEAPAFHAPAAAAHDMPETFNYHGEHIARNSAARLDLSCNQTETAVTCYDSQSEALRAMGVEPDGGVAARASGRKAGPRARAADLYCEANNGRPLVLFEHGDFGGWNVNAFTRQQWFNMQGIYDNNASSYRMGGHSGHMSENPNGGGYWYPGPTGVCDEGTHMGAYNWTDRTSSRYRN
jgi:hypothetical protein